MASPSLLDSLQGFLKILGERQQLVVTNMANVDTPGYHTRDIDFKSAMRQAMDTSGGPQLVPASLELNNLPERPDGNNVDIDRESMLLSEVQLQYQMGVQLIKDQFSTTLEAIKE